MAKVPIHFGGSGWGNAKSLKQKLPQSNAMQTTQFCYPYAYGMMESLFRGLAYDMVVHGVITPDQADEVQAIVDKHIALVKKKTEEYGN